MRFLNAGDHGPFHFVGAPYDGGASYRPGARFAPSAIRSASQLLMDGGHPDFDADPRALVTDRGDLCRPTANPRALRDIEDGVLAVLTDGGVPLVAGGDHAITLANLRAFKRHIGDSIGVIHLDAHCDTWPDNFTAESGHGTWVREAVEQGIVAAEHIMSLGMRGPVDHDVRDWLVQRGGSSIPMRRWLHYMGRSILNFAPWAATIPVWFTLDIDVLDPSCAPGTGTPEVGGMLTRELAPMIHDIATCTKVLGMDVVEVCPAHDVSEITALAAATAFWEFIAAKHTTMEHSL